MFGLYLGQLGFPAVFAVSTRGVLRPPCHQDHGCVSYCPPHVVSEGHRDARRCTYITGASRSSVKPALCWPSFAPPSVRLHVTVRLASESCRLRLYAVLCVCMCISISSWPGSVDSKKNPKKLRNLAKSSLPPSTPCLISVIIDPPPLSTSPPPPQVPPPSSHTNRLLSSHLSPSPFPSAQTDTG